MRTVVTPSPAPVLTDNPIGPIPTITECWANVVDNGTTLSQSWVIVGLSCFLVTCFRKLFVFLQHREQGRSLRGARGAAVPLEISEQTCKMAHFVKIWISGC